MSYYLTGLMGRAEKEKAFKLKRKKTRSLFGKEMIVYVEKPKRLSPMDKLLQLLI